MNMELVFPEDAREARARSDLNEIPNNLIAWRSLEGADVVSAGSVNFDTAAGGEGTRVTAHLQYSPPGGKIGAAVARLFGSDAETEIREDLGRFKQLLEAGEVPARPYS